MTRDIHPVLRRQLEKTGFNIDEIIDDKLIQLIWKISSTYEDADKSRYLTEHSMQISSQEMRELYESIKSEKFSLEIALNELIEKDKIIREKSKKILAQKTYSSGIIQSIPDILMVTDTDMRIVDANDATLKKLNMSEKELFNQKLELFLRHIPSIDSLINKTLLNKEKNYTLTFKSNFLVNKEKLAIPVLVSISAIVGNNRIVERLICIAKDISELVKLESENAEKLALITHAGRLASLGEMATGIAHELNQPLSIIRTNMQTLDMLEQMPQEERKEIITSSLCQVERASIIIDRMRGFARKQTGDLSLINIAHAIKSAISMFNEQFRLHNINIVYHQDDESIVVQAEPQEIEQIIINLITNSKFALEQKTMELNKKYNMQVTITVSYDNDNRQVILNMEDNGVGMDDETLAHCLEPFYTTKDMNHGTGLGLPIIHSIVKKHQGSIQISSKKNQGTSVIIKLPAKLGDNSSFI